MTDVKYILSTLGVKNADEKLMAVIPRFSSVPMEKTIQIEAPNKIIEIYEGEYDVPNLNVPLCKIKVDCNDICVTFNVDTNGTVKVTAMGKSTEFPIVIGCSTKDALERLKEEAEKSRKAAIAAKGALFDFMEKHRYDAKIKDMAEEAWQSLSCPLLDADEYSKCLKKLNKKLNETN